MGSYATKFQQNNSALPINCHPSKADWITSHAVVTKLAIVEVERLWKRFQQLGCNDNGELTDDIFERTSPVMQDKFSRIILTILRSDDKTIKFFTFLSCMQWAESAPVEEKISAVFQLLNNGQPLRKENMIKIIASVYPEQPQDHHRLTDILMEQLCGNANGEVNEAQFLERLKTFPPDVLAKLFSFMIVPAEINDEAHRAFTALSKGTAVPGNYANSVIPEESEPDQSRQIPSDNVLRQVAEKIYKQDWHLLANKLGFTEAKIKELEKSNDPKTSDQAFSMLRAWRQQEGSVAYAETLEQKLHQCNMNDAALLLYP